MSETIKNDKLKTKNKTRYEKFKDEINLYNKEIINCCLCNKKLKRGSLRSHQKSKLCIKNCEMNLRILKIKEAENEIKNNNN